MSRSGVNEITESGVGRATAPTGAGGPPDGVLLDLFLNERDGAAFEALVNRHGPKVMRICRRWLGKSQDADDAFQATFIVLVNRGGGIHFREDLGGWLCGVARKVAGRAKMQADRRRGREGAPLDAAGVVGRDGTAPDDLGPVLRAEVDRLPEKYRRPIELCYWEGLSSEQAAERLRCPTGTFKWRLSRAREVLRGRLTRLGVALAALLMFRLPAAEASGGGECDDVFSPDLASETVSLAASFRDAPPSFMAGGAPPSSQWIRGRRLRAIWWLVVLIVVLSFFPATPAFSQLSAWAYAMFAEAPQPAKPCH